MNAVATRPSGALTERSDADEGAEWEARLANIERVLLAWVRIGERMHRDHPGWATVAYGWQPGSIVLGRPPVWEGERMSGLAVLRERLAGLPPRETLAAACSAAAEAADGEFNANMTRALVGAMVDEYPNARPHSPIGYIESVVYEIGVSGFSHQVVAAATRELGRTKAFPPSVSEILAACTEAQKAAAVARTAAQRGRDARRAWEEAIGELMALSGLPETDPRLEPVPAPEWKEGDDIPF